MSNHTQLLSEWKLTVLSLAEGSFVSITTLVYPESIRGVHIQIHTMEVPEMGSPVGPLRHHSVQPAECPGSVSICHSYPQSLGRIVPCKQINNIQIRGYSNTINLQYCINFFYVWIFVRIQS